MKKKEKKYSEIMIVCAGESKYGIPGEWSSCGICGDKVYLSHSSLRAVEENGCEKEDAILYCFECAEPKLRDVEEFISATNEQKQEIKKHLRRAYQ